MREVEGQISPLIPSQLPEFYFSEGPLFIEFLTAYYRWMESSDKPLNIARSLPQFRDVDLTRDSLLEHFRTKFLDGVQFNELTNKRLLIKNALELYRAKGTERAFSLFFQLLFAETPEFYYPSVDLLSPSSGQWTKPVYLELSQSTRTSGWIGKIIRGITSGSSAIIQRIFQKRIHGKTITIAVIDNRSGNFITGELISDDGLTLDAPQIIGSLSFLTVVDGGGEHEIGDTVEVIDENGAHGLARVAETEIKSGSVEANLEYGGWGFTTTTDSNNEVKAISNLNIYLASVVFGPSDNFALYEEAKQVYYNIVVSNTSSDTVFVSGDTINLQNNTPSVVANGIVLSFSSTGSNTGSLVLRPLTGNANFFTTNNSFQLKKVGDSTHSANITSVANGTAVGNVIGFSSNSFTTKVGVRVETGTFITTNNNLVEFPVSNSNATVTDISLDAVVSELGFDLNINLATDLTSRVHYSLDLINDFTRPFMTVTADSGTFVSSSTNNIFKQANTSPSAVISVCNSTFLILSNVNGTFTNGMVVEQRDLANTVVANGTIDVFGPAVLWKDLALNSSVFGFNRQTDEIVTSNTVIIKALTFAEKQIGTFNRILNFSPGDGYNDEPMVSLFNPGINSLGLPDYKFTITSTRSFVSGELITANVFRTRITFTVTSNTNVRVFDRVFQVNSISSETANGYVYDLVGNTVTIERSQGTWIANTLHCSSTTSTPTVSNIQVETVELPLTGFVTLAANSTYLEADRWFYYQDFLANTGDQICSITIDSAGMNYSNSDTLTITDSGGSGAVANIITSGTGAITYVPIANCGTAYVSPNVSINTSTGTGASLTAVLGGIGFFKNMSFVGKQTGAVAKIVDVGFGGTTIGNNSILDFSTSFANGVIKTLEVIDSGFGYVNNFLATIHNLDRDAEDGTALIKDAKQGTNRGQYTSSNGFLSDIKKIQDGEYYQDFSYEIRSNVPFKQYEEQVLDLLHVAGTKLFGKIRINAIANAHMDEIETVVTQD
jgi:hypothetical protein